LSTHDPRQVIEDLRSHLATHDRRLLFLFGAGTSCAVNIAPDPLPGKKREYCPLIPGIDDLTAICGSAVAEMGADQAAAWDKLVKECETDGRPSNVENLLSKVRMKIDAVGKGETLVGLDRGNLCAIEKKVCGVIAKAASPAEDKIPAHTPHDEFAFWVKKVSRTVPLEIFTTNYDLLLERAFEASRVPVFDGFAGTRLPSFYPEFLEDEAQLPTSQWIRLWKLHGSVNWAIRNIDERGGERVVRSHPTQSGEMILPSHRKYDESRKQPFVAYTDRLTRLLSNEHSLLVTCGYSFRDEHINAILYGALDNRATSNIVALRFEELGDGDDLIDAAVRRSNLTVVSPNLGVISGALGTWQLTQPVDAKTHRFMDTAFDSDALLDDKGSPAASAADMRGQMRIGDFNWFCRFLNAMSFGVL